MIRYTPHTTKIIEGLAWFAQNAPDLDHYWALKAFFLAEVQHLNHYGRPIFGDHPHALSWGPVPMHALGLIDQSEGVVSLAAIRARAEAVAVVPSKTGRCLKALRSYDRNQFSRSDMECLQETLEACRSKTFDELVDCTSALPAYKAAWENRGNRVAVPMDWALLVGDIPFRDELVTHMRETSRHCVF
jgi:hypothetical protein